MINVIERTIVPYNPAVSQVHHKDTYNLFAPVADINKVGMAGFDNDQFLVDQGIVSLKPSAIIFIMQEVSDSKVNKTQTIANIDLQDNVTKEELRDALEIDNVNNTADIDKPVSNPQQDALDTKADKSNTYTKAQIDAKDINLQNQIIDNNINLQNQINANDNDIAEINAEIGNEDITTIAPDIKRAIKSMNEDIDSLQLGVVPRAIRGMIETNTDYGVLTDDLKVLLTAKVLEVTGREIPNNTDAVQILDTEMPDNGIMYTYYYWSSNVNNQPSELNGWYLAYSALSQSINEKPAYLLNFNDTAWTLGDDGYNHIIVTPDIHCLGTDNTIGIFLSKLVDGKYEQINQFTVTNTGIVDIYTDELFSGTLIINVGNAFNIPTLVVEKSQINGLNTDLENLANQKTYDLIIHTQEELDNMLESPTWLDAKSVLIIGGGGDKTINDVFVDAPDGTYCIYGNSLNNFGKVPQNVKYINGTNCARIWFCNAVNGFYYDNWNNLSSDKNLVKYNLNELNDSTISNLTLGNISNSVQSTCKFFDNVINITLESGTINSCNNLINIIANNKEYGALKYCYNLINCTIISCGSPYSECKNIINCYGKAIDSEGYTGFNAFSDCENINNCKGISFCQDEECSAFKNCKNLSNCEGKGKYAFYNIDGASNCNSDSFTIAMWGGENKNIDINTCCKEDNQNDNNTLNFKNVTIPIIKDPNKTYLLYNQSIDNQLAYLKLNILGSGNDCIASCTIDWGDGTIQEIPENHRTEPLVITKTTPYLKEGVYLITITGDVSFCNINNSPYAEKILEVYLGNKYWFNENDFYHCYNLVKVEFSPSWKDYNQCTKISNGAFQTCKNLSTINLPNNMTTIGNNAFSDCEDLVNMSIPNTITSIGENAFLNCNNLVRKSDIIENANNIATKVDKADLLITKQPNMTYVIFNAIAGDNTLHLASGTDLDFTINKGDGSLSITGNTSGGNHTLNYVTAGTYLITISGTFNGFQVSDPTVNNPPKNFQYLDVYIGSNCPIGGGSFYQCGKLRKVEISPDWNYSSIGDNAFSGCASLSVFLSSTCSSLRTVGDRVFYGCSQLSIIPKIMYSDITSTGTWTFAQSGIIEATICGVSRLSEGMFSNCNHLSTVNFPFYQGNIPIQCFANSNNLRSIYFGNLKPDTITPAPAIGDYAFKNCNALRTVEILTENASDLTVGQYAFDECRVANVIGYNEQLTNLVCSGITVTGGTLLTNYRKLY